MLPAERKGNQVQSGCINADMREDKNKKDPYQTHEKSRIQFSFFVWSMKIPASLNWKMIQKSAQQNFIFTELCHISSTHTYTPADTPADTQVYIQPVAICFAMFDQWCYDFEIKRTILFQLELISVSAVRAWGLTLAEWLLNLRGAVTEWVKQPGYFYTQIRNGLIIISFWRPNL